MHDPRIEAAAESIWNDNQDAGKEIPFGAAASVHKAFARAQARNALAAADAAAWQPIESAPKDGTPILAKVHDDLFPRVKPNRPDLEPWNGQEIVVHHPGILEDGFDLGWGMHAPVGHGGFPDEWFAGWRYVASCVPREVEG